MCVNSHTFMGRRFTVRKQAELRPPDLGECDYENRTLHIPVDGDTQAELDVIIHEMLHSCYPWMDEQYVEAGATDIARLLWRLGWRKE